MAPNRDLVSNLRREDLLRFFDSSPTARLLRADHAPFVLEFLHLVFKQENFLSLGQSDLKARLATFQSDLHASHPNALAGPADRYLSLWTDAQWLKRFIDATSPEPQFQLTTHAEEALRFLDASLHQRDSLVGTESRLRLIFDTLEDVVRGASPDPNQRLFFLKSQQVSLQQEIDRIESGHAVVVYQPAQIRERFQTAMQLLKSLQSDFRAVEERFQEIARHVQSLQHSSHDTRGNILGYALDAEDLLKQQDEGISFFAFVKFLLSPAQQNSLRHCIEEIQKLPALLDQQEALSHLRRMIPHLLAEADKVMRTTARLSATLRRLLDTHATSHRLRLASILHDIRTTALQLHDNPPSHLEWPLDCQPEIQAPLSRPFWSPALSFDPAVMREPSIDLDLSQRMLATLANLHHFDLRSLRAHIREATLEGQPIGLPQLLNTFPPVSGLIDLLGYLQIAHDDHHPIDPSQFDRIPLPIANSPSQFWYIHVPHVTFIPTSLSRENGRKPR